MHLLISLAYLISLMHAHGLFYVDFFLSFKIYMEFIAVFQNFKAFIFCLLHIFSQNRYGILLNPSWETGL